MSMLNRIIIKTLSLLLFVFSFQTSPSAHAADLVIGTFTSAGGTTIEMKLLVSNPAPTTLIVEQYMSPQNSVRSTSPQAKKVSPKNGKIKWLFRNLKPGKIRLTTHLNSPLTGQVKAYLRYRAPGTGEFTERIILP